MTRHAKRRRHKKEEQPAREEEPPAREEERREQRAEEERFIEDVLTRGEAAKPDEKGELPPGATHEIVEEHEGELPTIKRRRFSIG